MEFKQDGLLGDFSPRDRLSDFSPGQNLPDLGQSGMTSDMPDDPGPTVLGRTPLIGSVRRSSDSEVPVLRDRLEGLME
jgi:hypothetical protein